jgi:large subunit ribosomal protein L29
MKAKELLEKSVNELEQMERDLARDLWKTRFKNVTSQLDDTAKIRRLRRDIARVKTVLVQRASGSEGKSA